MRRWALAALLLCACADDPDPVVEKVRLRLVRKPEGRIGLEVLGAPTRLVAIQAELVLEAPSPFSIEDAMAPSSLPLDTVRLEARGANRAILFAGDKRGLQIPQAGELASFVVSGEGPSAKLRLGQVVVAGPGGQRYEVDLGPDLTIR